MCPVNIDMFIDCGSLILMLSIFILYIGLVPSFDLICIQHFELIFPLS